MLRITRETDYAVLLLTNLVAQNGQRRNARDMAEATRVPLPTVSKILKALARAGVLESQRGAKGGYQLATPPEEVSVAQVIRAIEGPIALTECVEEGGDCAHLARCPVQGNWNQINRAIEATLEKISLAEMAAGRIGSLPAAPRNGVQASNGQHGGNGHETRNGQHVENGHGERNGQPDSLAVDGQNGMNTRDDPRTQDGMQV